MSAYFALTQHTAWPCTLFTLAEERGLCVPKEKVQYVQYTEHLGRHFIYVLAMPVQEQMYVQLN